MKLQIKMGKKTNEKPCSIFLVKFVFSLRRSVSRKPQSYFHSTGIWYSEMWKRLLKCRAGDNYVTLDDNITVDMRLDVCGNGDMLVQVYLGCSSWCCEKWGLLEPSLLGFHLSMILHGLWFSDSTVSLMVTAIHFVVVKMVIFEFRSCV